LPVSVTAASTPAPVKSRVSKLMMISNQSAWTSALPVTASAEESDLPKAPYSDFESK
jgi:hypothetical protein